MTRFSETDKWRDPWFRSLKPPQKLLFLFVIDNCNNAGFWEEDRDYACYCTGMNEEQYQGALKGLTRGLVAADGWLWIRKFLKHQRNADLNPKNKAHSQIIRLLREQKLRFSKVLGFAEFIAPYEGLVSPPVTYSNVESLKEEEEKEEKPKAPKRITPLFPEEELQAARDRIGSLFLRRSTTKWSEKENEALLKVMPISGEDIEIVRSYYEVERKKPDGIHRRDILTFLNNYSGELDRANQKKRHTPACTV